MIQQKDADRTTQMSLRLQIEELTALAIDKKIRIWYSKIQGLQNFKFLKKDNNNKLVSIAACKHKIGTSHGTYA